MCPANSQHTRMLAMLLAALGGLQTGCNWFSPSHPTSGEDHVKNPNVLMFWGRRVSGLFAVGAGALLLAKVHAVGGLAVSGSIGFWKVHLAKEVLD